MAFDKLEVLSTRMPPKPARVALNLAGGMPKLVLSLNAAFTARIELKASDKFDVLLGTGEQKGLLRLKRSKTGIAVPKIGKQRVLFRLGHIERFGTEAEEKAGCDASVIDADTIEVVLPPWSQEQDV